MYWSIFKHAVIGKSHIIKKIPCQDVVLTYQKNGLSVMALADGLSSCQYSHIGAQIACEKTIKFLIRTFNTFVLNQNTDALAKDLLLEVKLELYDYSNKASIDIATLQSTLQFVAHDGKSYLYGRLGDGIIGTFQDHQVSILTQDLKTEAIELTDTTLSPLEKMEIGRGEMNNIQGFLIISDGTASGLVDMKANKFIKAASRLFTAISQMDQQTYHEGLKLMMNQHIREKTEDDCSIAITMKSDFPSFDDYEILMERYVRLYKTQDQNRQGVYNQIYRISKALKFEVSLEYIKKHTYLHYLHIHRILNLMIQLEWLIHKDGCYSFIHKATGDSNDGT